MIVRYKNIFMMFNIWSREKEIEKLNINGFARFINVYILLK